MNMGIKQDITQINSEKITVEIANYIFTVASMEMHNSA